MKCSDDDFAHLLISRCGRSASPTAGSHSRTLPPSCCWTAPRMPSTSWPRLIKIYERRKNIVFLPGDQRRCDWGSSWPRVRHYAVQGHKRRLQHQASQDNITGQKWKKEKLKWPPFSPQRATDCLQPEDWVLPRLAQPLCQGGRILFWNWGLLVETLGEHCLLLTRTTFQFSSFQAMRFPPKSYNKELESAEDRREREAQVFCH